MASQCCIAALGNPDEEYTNTRHNAGVILLEYLIEAFRAKPQPTKHKCSFWKAETGGITIHFIRPRTYMNLSGPPVSEFIKNEKIAPDRLLILHDEVDYSIGKVRIKLGGGSAGHNGLESLFEAVGTREFYRVRIGIGKPTSAPGESGADYVLSPFPPEQREVIDNTLKTTSAAIRNWVRGENEKAFQLMSKLYVDKKE